MLTTVAAKAGERCATQTAKRWSDASMKWMAMKLMESKFVFLREMAQMIVVDPAVVAVLDLGRGLDPVGAGAAAADATTAPIVLNTASRLTTFLRESTGLSSRIICERLERSLTSMLIIEWAKDAVKPVTVLVMRCTGPWILFREPF